MSGLLQTPQSGVRAGKVKPFRKTGRRSRWPAIGDGSLFAEYWVLTVGLKVVGALL
jgi:hypothetical protein